MGRWSSRSTVPLAGSSAAMAAAAGKRVQATKQTEEYKTVRASVVEAMRAALPHARELGGMQLVAERAIRSALGIGSEVKRFPMFSLAELLMAEWSSMNLDAQRESRRNPPHCTAPSSNKPILPQLGVAVGGKLPPGSKVPPVDFSKGDREDAEMNEVALATHYAPGEDVNVYRALVPIKDVISRWDMVADLRRYKELLRVSAEQKNCYESGSSEDCEQGMRAFVEDYGAEPDEYYEWSELFLSAGAFPPVKILVDMDGSPRNVDGNHRAAFWFVQGMTHAPAWVIDRRI